MKNLLFTCLVGGLFITNISITQAQKMIKNQSTATAFDFSSTEKNKKSSNKRGAAEGPKLILQGPKGEIVNGNTIETKKSTVRIRGKIISYRGVKSFTINGQVFFLEGDQTFAFPFEASRLNNNYTIKVTDKYNKTTTLAFNLRNTTKKQVMVRATTDKTPPVIKLTRPTTTRGITSNSERGLKRKKVYRVNKNKVEIAGELSDLSGIKSLTVNGHAVSVIDNRKFQYIYELSAKKTEIVIKATDNNDNVSVLKFILEKTNQTINPNETNLYIVSIGISKFQKSEYNLTYADDDAQGIHKTFTSPQNKKLFKNIKSKLLLNEQATRTNIIKSFQWLRKNATAKDLVVLFIASHGFNEDDNFYILPHDGNPDELLVSGVNWSALAITLSRLACRKMVFVDACHSAQLGEDLVKNRGANVSDIRKAQQVLKRKEYGTVLFSAASKAESSLEAPKWKHGAFTLAVMEALAGKADKNGDGIVFLSELNLYTLERVKTLTKGAQHPSLQNPASITQLPLCIVK
ncbi:hypothetical protein BKI52_21205 [marine bacterium AO1-C]|nr:hypothetical protein BKI52_21205 [marine bacterium AO1-C]